MPEGRMMGVFVGVATLSLLFASGAAQRNQENGRNYVAAPCENNKPGIHMDKGCWRKLPMCKKINGRPTCRPAPRCSKSWWCASPELLRRGRTCRSGRCTADFCCKSPPPTCKGFDRCPKNRPRRKNPAAIECTGPGNKCRKSDCCEPPSSCKGFTCPKHLNPLPKPGTIKCRGPECSRSECCFEPPTCKGFGKCSRSRPLRPRPGSIACQGTRCTHEECCSSAAALAQTQTTCKGFACPSHLTPYPELGDIVCGGGQCKRDDCCFRELTCKGFTCPDNEYLVPGPGKVKCQGDECAVEECCLVCPPPTVGCAVQCTVEVSVSASCDESGNCAEECYARYASEVVRLVAVDGEAVEDAATASTAEGELVGCITDNVDGILTATRLQECAAECTANVGDTQVRGCPDLCEVECTAQCAAEAGAQVEVEEGKGCTKTMAYALAEATAVTADGDKQRAFAYGSGTVVDSFDVTQSDSESTGSAGSGEFAEAYGEFFAGASGCFEGGQARDSSTVEFYTECGAVCIADCEERRRRRRLGLVQ